MARPSRSWAWVNDGSGGSGRPHCNRHGASASSSRGPRPGHPSGPRPLNGAVPLVTPSSAEAVASRLTPPPADTERVASVILDSLGDAKAEDVISLDLRGKTTLADTIILASGRSTTHVGAIADRITRACKDIGVLPKVEGLPHCDWVLVDASDVIVHVFRPEVRQFYNLEKLWGSDRPSERQAV